MSCLLIVFNQRMAYTEELMIKLSTLLKMIWLMEFDKANFGLIFQYKNRSSSRLEAHLVYKHTQKPKKLIR